MALSNQLHEMRYIFIPDIQQVPQWKQLYYDSKTLKKLTKMSQKSDQLITRLRRKYQNSEKTSINQSKSHKQIEVFSKIQHITRCQLNLKRIQHQSCQKIYQFSLNQMQTLYIFVQYKIFQLKERLDRLTYYSSLVQRNDMNLISLIQNTYIEIHYLKRMIQFNKGQESVCRRELSCIWMTVRFLMRKEGKGKFIGCIGLLIK